MCDCEIVNVNEKYRRYEYRLNSNIFSKTNIIYHDGWWTCSIPLTCNNVPNMHFGFCQGKVRYFFTNLSIWIVHVLAVIRISNPKVKRLIFAQSTVSFWTLCRYPHITVEWLTALQPAVTFLTHCIAIMVADMAPRQSFVRNLQNSLNNTLGTCESIY